MAHARVFPLLLARGEDQGEESNPVESRELFPPFFLSSSIEERIKVRSRVVQPYINHTAD